MQLQMVSFFQVSHVSFWGEDTTQFPRKGVLPERILDLWISFWEILADAMQNLVLNTQECLKMKVNRNKTEMVDLESRTVSTVLTSS